MIIRVTSHCVLLAAQTHRRMFSTWFNSSIIKLALLTLSLFLWAGMFSVELDLESARNLVICIPCNVEEILCYLDNIFCNFSITSS